MAAFDLLLQITLQIFFFSEYERHLFKAVCKMVQS
jgi:hypothetical protein